MALGTWLKKQIGEIGTWGRAGLTIVDCSVHSLGLRVSIVFLTCKREVLALLLPRNLAWHCLFNLCYKIGLGIVQK